MGGCASKGGDDPPSDPPKDGEKEDPPKKAEGSSKSDGKSKRNSQASVSMKKRSNSRMTTGQDPEKLSTPLVHKAAPKLTGQIEGGFTASDRKPSSSQARRRPS